MAADPHDTRETIEVPADEHHQPNPLSPDAQMVVWTWVTFAVVAFVLYKTAWKPILAALEAREGRIKQALDDAREAREAIEGLEEKRREVQQKADDEYKEMIGKARDAATEAAGHIEAKANDKVRIMYENAERDIEAMRNRVVAEMKTDQADMIVSLAGKLVTEELDDEKHRVLTDKLIEEF